MDLVIVYEDKAAVDSAGNVYIGTAFSNSALRCYLEHFDNVIMLMRHADVSPNDVERLQGMNRINDPRIKVEFIPNPTDSIRNFINIRLRREYRNKVVSQITPDRAVIIRAPSTSGSIAAGYCNKIGKTYLVEAIGCPWDSYWNHSYKGKILAPVQWLRFRRTMKHAPYAVYVTSEFLQHRYPTKGISAGISDVELQPMDDGVLEERLEKIRRHSGKLKIGTGGALVSYKGQQFVIEALARLKQEGRTDYEYHLAGDGDDQSLRDLARNLGVDDQVVFEGRLSHEQMFQWLDEMDFYIQPSIVESMPRALIEAMSRALPCVGTRVGSIPELLGDSCVFEKRDVGQIAELLKAISKTWMMKLADINFIRSKVFQRDLLEQRRRCFYAAYREAAEREYV